jgi:hypothetical protein
MELRRGLTVEADFMGLVVRLRIVSATARASDMNGCP